MEIERVDRITADAVGEPGSRTFYIQAAQAEVTVTVIVEKEQVQLLAASILEVLSRTGHETGPGPDDADMDLEQPFEPLWRVGRLSIGYQEDTQMLLLEMESSSRVRAAARRIVWATAEQMLALSRHGAEVCERGRPTCDFCGNPLDPEGHACPATNGHKKS
jgi:uncharacterized repeat protein (TIGR03847 family)